MDILFIKQDLVPAARDKAVVDVQLADFNVPQSVLDQADYIVYRQFAVDDSGDTIVLKNRFGKSGYIIYQPQL